MRDLDGRTCVVTGGASGIGLGVARRLVDEEARVVLLDADSAHLELAASELADSGALLDAISVDVTDSDAMEDVARTIEVRFAGTDLLVANAGIAGPPAVKLWDLPIAVWRRVFDVNVFGVVNTIRAFLPGMLERPDDGHVVVTASIRGLGSGSAAPQYYASKHAVMAVVESLRHQLAEHQANIGVSAVCPGPVRTPMTEHAHPAGEGSTEDASGIWVDAAVVAEAVVAAVRADTLYAFTHDASRQIVMERLDRVLAALDVFDSRPLGLFP